MEKYKILSGFAALFCITYNPDFHSKNRFIVILFKCSCVPFLLVYGYIAANGISVYSSVGYVNETKILKLTDLLMNIYVTVGSCSKFVYFFYHKVRVKEVLLEVCTSSNLKESYWQIGRRILKLCFITFSIFGMDLILFKNLDEEYSIKYYLLYAFPYYFSNVEQYIVWECMKSIQCELYQLNKNLKHLSESVQPKQNDCFVKIYDYTRCKYLLSLKAYKLSNCFSFAMLIDAGIYFCFMASMTQYLFSVVLMRNFRKDTLIFGTVCSYWLLISLLTVIFCVNSWTLLVREVSVYSIFNSSVFNLVVCNYYSDCSSVAKQCILLNLNICLASILPH